MIRLAAVQELNQIKPPSNIRIPSDEFGLERLLSVTLGLLTVIGGLIFVAWIIVGAYNWMTAEGKPDKIEKARTHIIQAISGLVILVGAYALAGALGTVIGFNIFDLSGAVSTLQNLGQ